MALAETMLPSGGAQDPGDAAAPSRSTATCWEGGCSAPGFVRCDYVDGEGQPCRTRWCAGHSVAVGERRYCRRHATTVVALGAKAGDPRALPAVGHRGASLVSWVFTEGHAALSAAVGANLRAGEVVFEDRAVNVSRTADGSRRWEQGWRIGDRTGLVRKVTLRVDEGDDALLSLVHGDRVVARGVPPWITRRRRGESAPGATDASDRQRFYAFLAGFVRDALSEPRER